MQCPVGLSDHTLGIGVAIASVALGACVIEKHVTLSRSEGGVDAAFSLEPAELATLVKESENAQLAVGSVFYGRTQAEERSLCFRRSLYVSQAIKAGEILTEKNLRIVRPGFGLAPKYFEKALGKRVKHDIDSGTPLQWESFE